jgi:hypothetical protein
MYNIIMGFACFLPYVFMLCVVGIIWDAVIRAFRGRGL